MDATIYVNPKDAFAMALFMFEGARLGKPDVRNIRNNNPGNLRPLHPTDKQEAGYRVFDTFLDGWNALLADIQYKIDHHPELKTVYDFINRYAPAGDNNSPTEYCRFVCHWLSVALDWEVFPSTPLADVFKK